VHWNNKFGSGRLIDTTAHILAKPSENVFCYLMDEDTLKGLGHEIRIALKWYGLIALVKRKSGRYS
jgi:hypothetical protein